MCYVIVISHSFQRFVLKIFCSSLPASCRNWIWILSEKKSILSHRFNRSSCGHSKIRRSSVFVIVLSCVLLVIVTCRFHNRRRYLSRNSWSLSRKSAGQVKMNQYNFRGLLEPNTGVLEIREFSFPPNFANSQCH